MRKIRHRQSRKHTQKLGLPPGALVHVGEVRADKTEMCLIQYQDTQIEEKIIHDFDDTIHTPGDNRILWLNVYGLHQPELLSSIGSRFNLHPLVMEDILNTNQRPKLDIYDDYIFIVSRFFSYDATEIAIKSEQISIVLGKGFVLSFQERRTGSFEPIRERLRLNKGQIRKTGADYLTYSLLDMIVDRYFIVLEQIGDDCDLLENELLHKPTNRLLQEIHKLKRETMELRHAVWPLREVINALNRNECELFKPETLPYLRDVYDHTVHFIESLESLRDLLAGMLDIYLSTISNRVNMEVRALTVVAMLFMPATLIAGIFGMNFKVMPLLQDPDGFWFAMGMMATIAITMGLVFWRRQWLER